MKSSTVSPFPLTFLLPPAHARNLRCSTITRADISSMLFWISTHQTKNCAFNQRRNTASSASLTNPWYVHSDRSRLSMSLPDSVVLFPSPTPSAIGYSLLSQQSLSPPTLPSYSPPPPPVPCPHTVRQGGGHMRNTSRVPLHRLRAHQEHQQTRRGRPADIPDMSTTRSPCSQILRFICCHSLMGS